MENEKMIGKTMACTHCGSLECTYYSWYTDKNGLKYRNYKCKACGRNFCEKPRKYTFEQKQEAIDCYIATKSNKKAAELLKCSAAQIVKWRREFVEYGLISENSAPRINCKHARRHLAAAE